MREPKPGSWSAPGRALHWLAALLILTMLGLGLTMTHLVSDSGARFDLYQNHKSLGFCVLAVMLLRTVWRGFTSAPAAPPATPAWQNRLAQLTHLALYLAIFAMIISGWLNVSASPLPLPTRFFGLFTVPNIAPANMALSTSARAVHAALAWVLIGLIAVHIAAALKHHLIDRDDVLKRMLPFQ